MAAEQARKEEEKEIEVHHGGSSDAVYGLGMIGAWMFYLKGVKTFKEGAIGVLKGFVWPVFLVRDLLLFLHKE